LFVSVARYRGDNSPDAIIAGSAVAVILCLLIVVAMVILLVRRSVSCRSFATSTLISSDRFL